MSGALACFSSARSCETDSSILKYPLIQNISLYSLDKTLPLRFQGSRLSSVRIQYGSKQARVSHWVWSLGIELMTQPTRKARFSFSLPPLSPSFFFLLQAFAGIASRAF